MTRCCCPAGSAIPTGCAAMKARWRLIRAFDAAGKPIGGDLPCAVAAGRGRRAARARRATSWPSIRTDIRNAGGRRGRRSGGDRRASGDQPQPGRRPRLHRRPDRRDRGKLSGFSLLSVTVPAMNWKASPPAIEIAAAAVSVACAWRRDLLRRGAGRAARRGVDRGGRGGRLRRAWRGLADRAGRSPATPPPLRSARRVGRRPCVRR